MTQLTYRIPRDPRDGSCRHASVPGARQGQRGFAPRQGGQFLECQPAREDGFHAGFRIEVCTP